MRNNSTAVYKTEFLDQFYAALATSDHENVQRILWDFPNFRADIDPETGETPILKVCKTDDVAMAKILLRGDDSIYADRQGNPPLNVACIYGRVEMTKFLISRDVNVNLASASSWSRLDDGKMVEIVGKTALEIAYENSNADLIRILEPLTDPQIRKKIAASEIEKLQQEREILEREKAEFVKKQAEFEARQAEFEKAEKEREERVSLQMIKVRNEKFIQDLAAMLKGGVNIFDKNKEEISVNARDRDWNTLLHHIAKRSDIQSETATIFSAIIAEAEFKAELNLRNRDGDTPLMTACRFGNFIAANILLNDSRVDFEAENKDGTAALHYLATKKTEAAFLVAARIIEKVNVDFLSKKAGLLQVNALHVACRAGNSNLAALLIEKGVDYTIKNRADESPLAIMKGCGTQEDLAKMNAAILRAACRKGDYDSAVELIKKGVSYTMEGNNGDSAVKIMKECGSPEDKEKMTAAIREVVTKNVTKKLPGFPSTSITPRTSTEENAKKLSANYEQQSFEQKK